MHEQPYRETDRQIDRQRDRQRDRQIDRQTDRQTDRHMQTNTDRGLRQKKMQVILIPVLATVVM